MATDNILDSLSAFADAWSAPKLEMLTIRGLQCFPDELTPLIDNASCSLRHLRLYVVRLLEETIDDPWREFASMIKPGRLDMIDIYCPLRQSSWASDIESEFRELARTGTEVKLSLEPDLGREKFEVHTRETMHQAMYGFLLDHHPEGFDYYD